MTRAKNAEIELERLAKQRRSVGHRAYIDDIKDKAGKAKREIEDTRQQGQG